MEKPQQIGRFAMLAMVGGLINFVATSVLSHFTARGLIGATVGIAIILALVAWTVKGRSPIARLALTVWLTFGIGATLASYGYLVVAHRTDVMSPGVQTMSLFTTLANCIALVFLWSRASTAWLQSQTDPS